MQIEFFPVLYFQQLRWPLRVKKRLSPVVGPDYSSTVPTMWSRWPEPTLVDFPLQSAMIKAPPHGVSIASLQKPQKWSKASKCIIQLFRPFDFRICVTFSSLSFFLANSCNNVATCEISASDFDFGPNPCPDTERYLEASYICVQKEVSSPSATGKTIYALYITFEK